MALVVPKIIYPSGGGTTLTFVYPPRNVPFNPLGATRHDNFSSSGVKEAIHERADTFFEFDMENVLAGTDITNWQTFMQYALQGGTFDYYPDATLGSLTTYFLEDTGWNPTRKSLGIYTFHVKFRKAVAWP